MHEWIVENCGTSANKCMACGKCSAACPAFAHMDYGPHHMVALLRNGGTPNTLATANTLWECASCHTCEQRCPRGVSPMRIIEAARQWVVRQQNNDHLVPEEVENPQVPQQLLVSGFRKYRG